MTAEELQRKMYDAYARAIAPPEPDEPGVKGWFNRRLQNYRDNWPSYAAGIGAGLAHPGTAAQGFGTGLATTGQFLAAMQELDKKHRNQLDVTNMGVAGQLAEEGQYGQLAQTRAEWDKRKQVGQTVSGMGAPYMQTGRMIESGMAPKDAVDVHAAPGEESYKQDLGAQARAQARYFDAGAETGGPGGNKSRTVKLPNGNMPITEAYNAVWDQWKAMNPDYDLSGVGPTEALQKLVRTGVTDPVLTGWLDFFNSKPGIDLYNTTLNKLSGGHEAYAPYYMQPGQATPETVLQLMREEIEGANANRSGHRFDKPPGAAKGPSPLSAHKPPPANPPGERGGFWGGAQTPDDVVLPGAGETPAEKMRREIMGSTGPDRHR